MNRETSLRGITLKYNTMHIPDPMFQDEPSRCDEIERKRKIKQNKSKIKAEQSFAKAHSKRRKKK